MEQFFTVLGSIPTQGGLSLCQLMSHNYAWLTAGVVDEDAVTFCERFLELVTDLEAQLPTRRFFNTLLDSCNFVVTRLHVQLGSMVKSIISRFAVPSLP